MSADRSLPTKLILLYSLATTVLFLLFFGYQFNTGDQLEHLPPVYQKLDASLYPHDFYMNAYNQTFTVRYFFVELIYLLSFVGSVSTVCFILTFLCIWASIMGIMKLAGLYSNNPINQVIAPIFVLFIFYYFTVGGNQIQYNILTCSTLAKALGIWGIYFCLKEKWLWAFVLVGVASLFQVLVGFQLFLIFGGIVLIHLRKYSLVNIFVWIACYFLFAGCMLIPILLQQKASITMDSESHKLFYLIMNEFRNPAHYEPQLFPLMDYFKASALLITASLMLYKSNLKLKSETGIFILLILGGIVVYVLLNNVFHIYEVTKIQWFKTTIWLALFSSIVISFWVSERLSFFQNLILSKPIKIASLAFILVGMFAITNSSAIPIEKFKHRYKVGNYERDSLEKMYEWVSKNTQEDAVFLVPPDDMGFLCQAKRSQVISFKAIIHEPKFMMDWYRKVSRIYGVDISDLGDTSIMELAVNNYYTKQFSFKQNERVAYRLDNLKTCKFSKNLGKTMHQSGDWILTKFEPSHD